MVIYPFREHHPVRTCSKVLTDYKSYKKYLVKDFNRRCGYTDCPDWWFGGKTHFHIDHFLPHSNPAHFHLKHSYSNLIYACSFINGVKSNKEGDFLDPCANDYNLHFYRNELGEIIPRPESKYALFMYEELKLGLKRYSLIWLLTKLDKQMSVLGEKLKNLSEKDKRLEILELRNELLDEYQKYNTYLRQDN